MAAKKGKIPRNVNLPWSVPRAIAASDDGAFVVVAGENDAIARLDTVGWELVVWPKLEALRSTNALAISPDGSRVAISVTGASGAPSGVEVRDREGAVLAFVPTPRNVRASWAPGGDLLVARVEADVDFKQETLAFVDPKAKTFTPIELGPLVHAAATFVGDEAVLAFVKREGLEHTESFRILRIDRAGAAREVGATKFWDAYARMLVVGADRALVVGYNRGWHLVDATGARVIAEGGGGGLTAARDGDGFVVGQGKKVTRLDATGNPRGEATAKSRIDGVAAIPGALLVLEGGVQGKIEIVTS